MLLFKGNNWYIFRKKLKETFRQCLKYFMEYLERFPNEFSNYFGESYW